MSEPAVTMLYALTITARGLDTEVHIFTTGAARHAALVEFVTDNWSEYFHEDIPDDPDIATERFHQETDVSWNLDESVLEGPILPAVILIAKLRALLMGHWESAPDLLDVITGMLFDYPGLPDNRDIHRDDGHLADWSDIDTAWDRLLEDPARTTLPTPDEIQAYLIGDGNPHAAQDRWIDTHSAEAERQGWSLYEDSDGVLSIRMYGEVFDNDQAALLYVQRQAQREQPPAVTALELIDQYTPKKGHTHAHHHQ